MYPPAWIRTQPPHRPAKYGAKRYETIDLPWKEDVETFCEKSSDRYGLHVEANLVSKYRIDEPGKSGEFRAWSILEHCHRLKTTMKGGKSIDWDGMETDLRVPAEEVVKQELCDLKERADRRSGREKREALEKIENRKLILLLGENVLLEERNGLGSGYTPMKGMRASL
jgi:hypothetical protein